MGLTLLELSSFLILVSVLAGCGGSAYQITGAPLPSTPAPLSEEDRREFLRRFPVLDESGNESPPKEPSSGTFPFGVLIGIPGDGRAYYCSTSHISAKHVVANAHCLQHSSRPSDYYIVFYDHHGTKTFSRIPSFNYVGSQTGFDLAVLDLDPEAAERWDTAGNEVWTTKDSVGQVPPRSFAVKIWAFDPLPNHPSLSAIYGSSGMVFKPRFCNASRTRPGVAGVTQRADGSVTREPISPPRADASIHVFLDDCNRPLVHGNSGSLITMKDHFAAKIGVYHWGFGPSDRALQIFDRFEYTGNDGKSRELGRNGLAGGEFFGVGSVFEVMTSEL